ncbi:MAG: hypothetical protein M3Q81_05455 [bacterium]|nr:hypothetical protein [bacterium]
MTRKILLFLRIAVICFILLSLYFARAAYVLPWEYQYLQNAYDHSQWSIPLSTRILSDNQLYQVAGYKIVQGADLFSINPEVPPLGKYLYGLAAVHLGNPHWASAIIYLLTLLAFWLCTRSITTNQVGQAMAAFLFVTTPLVFAQLSQTMLDLPQLLFLLLHLVAMSKVITAITSFDQVKNPLSWLYLLLAGLSLGAFAGTKIPLFVPVILVVDAVFLVLAYSWSGVSLKMRLFTSGVYVAVLCGVSAAVYVALYTPYFLSGHSLLDFLGAQKWMLSFYMNSSTTSTLGIAVVTVLGGWWRGWSDSMPWQLVREWTLLWPILLSAAIYRFSFLLKLREYKSSLIEVYILVTAFALFFVMLVTPFWPRYFLLVLPLLIVVFSKIVAVHQRVVGAVILLSALHFCWYVFSPPTPMLEFVAQKWEQQHYRDLYEYSSPNIRESISREDFTFLMESLDAELQVSTVSARVITTNASRFSLDGSAEMELTKYTPLGAWSYPVALLLSNSLHQWQLDSYKELVAPGFEEGDTLVMELDQVSDGVLKTRDGVILSRPGTQAMLYVTADKIGSDQEFLQRVESVTGVRPVDLEKIIYVDGEPSIPQEIAPLLPDIASDSELIQHPAIKLVLAPSREYSAEDRTRVPVSTIRSIESEYPSLFAQRGGRILLQKSTGERDILMAKDSRMGSDVTLEQSHFDIL